MAEPDLGGVLYLPGQLIINPTDLTVPGANEDYGGTKLGLAQDVVVEPIAAGVRLRTEEFGPNAMTEYVEHINGWRISVAFRTWDDDVIETLFQGTAAGATKRIITGGPSDERSGLRASERSVVLVYIPLDVLTRPSFLFHRAVPMVDDTAGLNADLDLEGFIGGVFEAIPAAANDRAHSAGLLADIAGRL